MNHIEKAQRWLEQDPDPETQRELKQLIAAGNDHELAERFSGPLEFGTAGLRGILGAGESRMNRAVVRRTSAGLAAYLLEHTADAAERGIVVGYDGRRGSRVFAEDTAAVLAAAGLRVFLSQKVCPTPLVAFAVIDRKAAAGVMVTASHNPPEYNGYKVYAENGAQIVPPADRLIAAAIASGPAANAIHLAALDSPRIEPLAEAMDTRYLAAVEQLYPAKGPSRDLDIVYTPLHGVGNHLLRQAMAAAGFSKVHTVAEQAEPDGSFPTVRFPNPEEDGALDLALALAEKQQAALILANDPDADRLAAVVRTAQGYVPLSGNEIGTLLGHHALQRDRDHGPKQSGKALVITTIVSSPLLGVMAQSFGASYNETLTGFKWIANKAIERQKTEGCRFLMGYEEALGYTVKTVARDKDGIGAAVVFATMAADLKAKGETLVDELTRIYQRFGLYASSQHSLHFPGSEGKSTMAELMSQLRNNPPTEIAGHTVEANRDYLSGKRTVQDGKQESIDLPSSNVLVYELAGGHRVIARPSGTEPKVKVYFDVREPMGDDDSLSAAKERASKTIAKLKDAMLARLAPA